MSDVAFGLVFGALFIGVGVWRWTHGFWALRIDRVSFEQSPGRATSWNLRLSWLLARRLVPAALIVLGAIVVVAGVSGKLM